MFIIADVSTFLDQALLWFTAFIADLKVLDVNYEAWAAGHVFLAGAFQVIVVVVLGLLVLALAFKILAFVCKILYKIVDLFLYIWYIWSCSMKDLVKGTKMSANPWGLILGVLFSAGLFHADLQEWVELPEVLTDELLFGLSPLKLGAFVFLICMLIYYFLRAKSKMPLVLLAKFLRIPFDVISIPCWILDWILGFFYDKSTSTSTRLKVSKKQRKAEKKAAAEAKNEVVPEETPEVSEPEENASEPAEEVEEVKEEVKEEVPQTLSFEPVEPHEDVSESEEPNDEEDNSEVE